MFKPCKKDGGAAAWLRGLFFVAANTLFVAATASADVTPTVTRTVGPSTAGLNVPTTFTFHVEDPDGNLNGWEIAYQNPSGGIGQFITWQTIPLTGTYEFSQAVTFPTAGTWHIWVNARDSVGHIRDPWLNNIADDRLAVTVSAVNGPPTVTHTSGPVTASIGTPTTYSFHLEDPDGNLNAWEVAYRTPSGSVGQFVAWQGIANTTTYDFSQSVVFSTPGTWQIWVNGRDSNGLVRDPWANNIPGDRLTVVVSTTYSTPSYTPSFWNDASTIQYHNNCYNYSNNRRTDTYAQPGRAAGQTATTMSASAVSSAAIADGLEPAGSSTAISPSGKTLIALVIWPNNDYHWYRRDSNGLWSHKPGQNLATNIDNSGNLITNPESANRGDYTVFAGYFFTPSDSVEGQGHASIN